MATIIGGIYQSLLLIAVMPIASWADVERASADSFLVIEQADSAVSPATAIAKFAEVGNWWSAEHTYSGSARSLRLTLSPGGCFCETWTGGSVEHARVLMVINGKMVRLKGALGPLQGMAVDAVLDVTAAGPAGNGRTSLRLSYLVNGARTSELDKIAPAVDRMMNDTLLRLVRYLDSDKPLD